MEALVSMLILSLFFLASSRAITQKQTVEIQKNPHGYYECYVNGGTWEHLSISNVFTKPVPTNNCEFTPPVGVTFFNVHYFDGTEYFNSQQIILNEKITLGGPGGIASAAMSDSVATDDMTPQEQARAIQERNWEFKTYLEMTHPSSNIYTIWRDTGEPPSPAAMIAW